MIIIQIILSIVGLAGIAFFMHYIISGMSYLSGTRIVGKRGNTIATPDDFIEINQQIGKGLQKGLDTLNNTKEEIKKKSLGNYSYLFEKIKKQNIYENQGLLKQIIDKKKSIDDVTKSISRMVTPDMSKDKFFEIMLLKDQKKSLERDYILLANKLNHLNIDKFIELNQLYYNFDSVVTQNILYKIDLDNGIAFFKLLSEINSEFWSNNLTKEEATKLAHFLFNHYNDVFKKSTGMPNFY